MLLNSLGQNIKTYKNCIYIQYHNLQRQNNDKTAYSSILLICRDYIYHNHKTNSRKHARHPMKTSKISGLMTTSITVLLSKPYFFSSPTHTYLIIYFKKRKVETMTVYILFIHNSIYSCQPSLSFDDILENNPSNGYSSPGLHVTPISGPEQYLILCQNGRVRFLFFC